MPRHSWRKVRIIPPVYLNNPSRHQKLGRWNGSEYEAEFRSTGGCSGLGVSSDGELGLVYKATESSGGVYRTLVDDNGTIHDYQFPLSTTEIPELRKFNNYPLVYK